jgi:hypothetical protein
MAHKRMFSRDITGSDVFREMPASAQNLYFHLGMEADDDGFIGAYKTVQRAVSSADDDLKILLGKRFIIRFDSGVLVVKHWLINNTIRKDRYNETRYRDEKRSLYLKDNLAYSIDSKAGIPLLNQTGIPKLATQKRIEENRIDMPKGMELNPEENTKMLRMLEKSKNDLRSKKII